jgi:protein TonB
VTASKASGRGRTALRQIVAALAAAVFSLGLFLILPFMQSIGKPPEKDLIVRESDVADVPPPPPAPPEPEPERPEPEEQPPELIEQPQQPLDLAQLEIALNPVGGSGSFGDFAVNLGAQISQVTDSGGGGLDEIFSMADLDQRPRVLFQAMPQYPPELRRMNRQGTVYVVFTVDTAGKVVGPKVDRSSDPAFERPAMEAVSQWRFEPGTRKGEKVPFKMRVPITFNAG